GFVLLHYLGMQQTLWIAALLNFLVAACAGLGSRQEAWVPNAVPQDLPPRIPDPTFLGRSMALSCAAMTGVTSMALEVTWSRVLGILTSNSAYSFALVLTVLLLGLGLGSLVQAWWSRHPGDNWRRMALCQWFLAGVILLSLPFLTSTPRWLERCCESNSA